MNLNIKNDMPHLQHRTGISQRELLFNLLSGLQMVEKNLQKYPEEIQLREATFSFSAKQVQETLGKVSMFIGFEHSNTREYSIIDTSTFAFSKKVKIPEISSEFEWQEIGINLQLEFAGHIMRDIADEILVSRQLGIPLKNITSERSFAITKSNTGSLELKFFNELLEISAKRRTARTVTNNLKIIFEPKSNEPKPPIA